MKKATAALSVADLRKKSGPTNITLTGESGDSYDLGLYSMDSLGSFPPINAIYVFVTRTRAQKTYSTKAIYVGETGEADDRLTKSHEKMKCVKNEGATHVAIYEGGYRGDKRLLTERGRREIEKDMVDRLNPPCNLEG